MVHNSWHSVNWLVGWLDGCPTGWLAAWLSGMGSHTVVVHLAQYCFSAARFCYVNCNTMLMLAALGGKLIAFAAQLSLFSFFCFSVFGFYYLKFMSVFSEELSQRESEMQFSCLLTHSRCLLSGSAERKRKLQSNCSVYCVFCSSCRRFPVFLIVLQQFRIHAQAQTTLSNFRFPISRVHNV